MDDPNITMEEYIRLEEEKARRHGKVYNWETATYGRIWDDDEVHNLRAVRTEFPSIVFDDTFTSQATLSCEPTVSPLKDNEIDFRISFDEFDDEDYTVIFDKKSFSYKIIFVDNLKTDSENNNDKVNMPSFPSPEPTVSYFDDLDYLKDFENEFPAIVYNDALTSKSDFLIEPTINPQYINEFKEISLSECDEEEQNVLYFNDLFPFNIIYPDGLKSDEDNDGKRVDTEQLTGDIFVIPSPDKINIDVYTYAQGLNKLLKTRKIGLQERIRRIRTTYEHRDAQVRGISLVQPQLNFISIHAEVVPQADCMQHCWEEYLRMFASGSKREAMISGGQFVARLAEHFRMLIEERLQGLTMIVQDLPMIDMDELVSVVGALDIAEGAPNVDEGDQAVLAPIQAPQPPPTAGPARTTTQRIARLEEDVHGMRGALGEQREVLDSWGTGGHTPHQVQLAYVDFQIPYVRRTRRGTDDANTLEP
ncbi:hypothetical protein Tco_1503833 [Tanacetum coccineum]